MTIFCSEHLTQKTSNLKDKMFAGIIKSSIYFYINILMPYLSCRQMHEDVERLHALFYCPDGVEG